MRAGVFQCNGGGLTTSQRLDRLAAAAGRERLDLIACPELFLSGYDVGDSLLDMAEARGGPFAASVADIARSSGSAILYGYPERDGEHIFNSASCIDSSGKIIANHRKLFFPPGRERRRFTGGRQLTLFDLGGVRCGILICYDAELPELMRATAEAGAEVIIVPTALTDGWRSVAFQLIPTRAFENGVWLLYANHAGTENKTRYLGASCIVGPDGRDAARAGDGEELVHAELDLGRISMVRDRLPYVTEAFQVRDLVTMAVRGRAAD